ncbi:MAG: iron ABC transporter permease [Oscillospiraceae bacterium]|nr:iron ABC transporter permease [Oscillospiraceae bacterium]
MNKCNLTIKYVIMAAVLGITAAAALMLGSAGISPADAVRTLIFGGEGTASVIMRTIRLPRVLAAFLAGTGLSVSGTLLQGVTDNGLASPNIIGVNSGAGFLTVLLLAFSPEASRMLPFAAFFGALVATLLIVGIAGRIGTSKITVILAGMVLTTILNSGISLIALINTDVLAAYNYFSVGGIGGISLDRLAVPAVFIAVSFAASVLLSPRIDALCLGDSLAASLGIRVARLRTVCLIAASASAAASVSFAGLLGFVGLIVPHITKFLVGGGIRRRILASPFVGGSLVILADLLGRTVVAPTEIPVGIVMAAIGAPFFLILLLRRGYRA